MGHLWKHVGRVGGVAVCLAVMAPLGAGAAATSAHGNSFRQANLVSDIPGRAALTDPDLVNPWGLAAGPTTPLWVADNGTGVATIYPGHVGGQPIVKAGLVVTVPAGAPTGQVFNPTPGFDVATPGGSAPATFLFDSEAGTISAWPFTNPVTTSATTEVTVPGAVFKGLTLAMMDGRPTLYAADFHHGRVVVVNSQFHVVSLPGRFHDSELPDGYAPFGIQAIGNRVVVTYGKQDAAAHDEIDGAGLGFVDVYSSEGQLIKRLVKRGALNAPWGLARAPSDFGAFGGALLVGNFGNGRINAYDMETGKWLGQLRRPDGSPIQISGLWGLRFGNGVTGGPETLLFSAGLDHEAHGLLGAITDND